MTKALATSRVEGISCAAEPNSAAVVERKGRVLLLEDDPTFQEILTGFLEENGYTVVPVKSGGEGVAQVLTDDFALVLCDLMMPGLPGDLFYRAVERIRPDLCARFVFMSGYRGDAQESEYIDSVGCWVLHKPFPLDELLALFAFTEARETLPADFEGTLDVAPAQPDLSAVEVAPAPATSSKKKFLPVEPLLPVVPVAAWIVRPPSDEPPVAWVSTANVPAIPLERKQRREFASKWLDLTVVLAVVLGFQYLDKHSAAATELAQNEALEAEWAALSADVQVARAGRSASEHPKRGANPVLLSREAPRWAPALRDIALAAGQSIQILEVTAVEHSEDPGACEARIRGVATGGQPRIMADRFRKTVEESVTSDAGGRAVTVRLEELEDAAGASPTQQQATFFMNVTIAAIKSTAPIVEEGL